MNQRCRKLPTFFPSALDTTPRRDRCPAKPTPGRMRRCGNRLHPFSKCKHYDRLVQSMHEPTDSLRRDRRAPSLGPSHHLGLRPLQRAKVRWSDCLGSGGEINSPIFDRCVIHDGLVQAVYA